MLRRTIAIPVAEIIEGGTKDQFYEDLRKTLDLCRRAANKSVTMCLHADTELMTGGKCPKLYTYPIVASEFPGIAAVASSVCRAVESHYLQHRWAISVGRESATTYRSFPYPLLHNASRRLMHIEDAGEYLTARIKLLSGWWTVRLAGGSAHRDQVRGIRNAVSIGDSKIWCDRKHKAIIGVSVATEQEIRKNMSGSLDVMSSRDALLVATKERSEVPFTINGDQVLHWIAERTRKQTRLSQDRKSGSSRQPCKVKASEISEKWKRRITSFIHQVSSQVVEHAKRRRIETVNLDLTVKSFVEAFPWFQLAQSIKYKCEDAGIAFVNSTMVIAEPDVKKPHVYFKFSPSTGRVKIGKTCRDDGGRHGTETDSPEELIILAVDNQAKVKLTAREKHHHSYFSAYREKGEWFAGAEVVKWLREVGWLGNAGNISQIAQYLDV